MLAFGEQLTHILLVVYLHFKRGSYSGKKGVLGKMYSSSENSNNSTTQSKRCRRRQWRELETWFFAALILSTAFVGGGQARNIQRPLRSHQQPLIRAAAPKSSWTSSYAPVTGHHTTNDDFGITDEARSLMVRSIGWQGRKQ